MRMPSEELLPTSTSGVQSALENGEPTIIDGYIRHCCRIMRVSSIELQAVTKDDPLGLYNALNLKCTKCSEWFKIYVSAFPS